MKNAAEQAVESKIGSVESEQGDAKSAGGEPTKNFGHSSAPSAGVGGSIPVGDGGMGGGKKGNGY